jgi:drug/metabolite transporter (DMT)-like permease
VVFYVLYDIAVKEFAVWTGNYKAAMAIMGISIIPMIVVACVVHSPLMGDEAIALAAASGIFLFLGFELLYRSLHTEQLTKSIGLNNVGTAVLVLFGVLVLHEAVSGIGLLGMLFIFGGAYLLLAVRKTKINKHLIPSVLAGISFSIFWILMSYSIASSGNFIIPLVISRAVGFAIVAVYVMVFARGKDQKAVGRSRSLYGIGIAVLLVGIVAGLADGVGDTLFAFVTLNGYLAMGSALTLLGPIFAGVFAHFIYKDRLTRAQLLGFVIIVVGAVLLTVF